MEEFDEVLYGSESETESDGEGEGEANATASSKNQRKQNAKNSRKQTGAKLRLDDDEPMDLLEGVGMRIQDNAKSRRKPGQEASRFKTDGTSGKMIIEDSDSSADENPANPRNPGKSVHKGIDTSAVAKGDTDGAGTAYIESMISTDGFTRGPNGRVKFNKDTKKRRRAEAELEDSMDVDEPAAIGAKTATPPNKKLREKKLGHEFKAKKAGGDVKKGGLDPYAYVPLGQAARHQKGGKGRIGIASKR